MNKWLVTVTIAGRDAGSWSSKATKPWTAIYHTLLMLESESKFTKNDELAIVCRRMQEAQ